MSAEERKDLVLMLSFVERAYGSDAYKTPGKAPVMNADLWSALEPYAAKGLVALHEDSVPLIERDGRTYIGRGFVSLTEAGRALVPAPTKH